MRPVDGFRSPPHIHNVSYRGVVIQGRIHNDAPDAPDKWMTKGAFWTQPKGAVHITAALGSDALAYIEIDEGPYLVRPVDKALDTSEEAQNTHAADIAWTKQGDDGVEVASLWGEPTTDAASGSFIRLPQVFAAPCTASVRAFARWWLPVPWRWQRRP